MKGNNHLFFFFFRRSTVEQRGESFNWDVGQDWR